MIISGHAKMVQSEKFVLDEIAKQFNISKSNLE